MNFYSLFQLFIDNFFNGTVLLRLYQVFRNHFRFHINTNKRPIQTNTI